MSTSAPDFPSSIDAVTPAWLGGVLGVPLAAIRPERIGEGVGLMGEIYRVGLDYADGASGPASVVVKVPAQTEGSRAQGVALGMYEAEVRFYNELAPRTPSGLPRVDHARIVSGTADFVIVMEDLSGLRQVEQTAGMSVDQALAAVRTLAEIHAAWWGKVQTPELEWIPSIVHDRIRMVDGMLPAIWQGFAAGFGSALPEGGVALGDKFASNYFNLMQGFASRPWTLLHQDFRVENLLFGAGPDGDGVVVIDWQGIGRGPGGYDVAYVLGGSLPTAERRTHERALVAAYHEVLTANGVDYPAEAVWDDYRYGMVLGGLAVTLFAAGTLDLTNDRAKALVASMAERHFTAALDHGGVDLIPF